MVVNVTKPTFNSRLNLIVRDKNGKLLTVKNVKCHSWLKQFLQMLKVTLSATHNGSITSVDIKDIDGIDRSYISPYEPANKIWALNCVANSSLYGVFVGSGSTANTINTYNLASKINHGTGSGQLVYGAHIFEDVTNPSGNTLRFRITRTFTNNSGSTVTVREIGLCPNALSGVVFCIARDVLSEAVNIPDGATLTVRYVVEITVS